MPKLKTTYAELYARQLNLLKFRNEYFALAACPAITKWVRQYEKFNTIPLTFLQKKEKELLIAHVEHDERGNPLFEPEKGLSIAGEETLHVSYRRQNNLVPVFIDAEHARQFNEEWMRLMNLPCEIQL